MADRNNKIALVTGSSRGLGRNTALHLARRAVDCVVTYHSAKAEAETVVSEIEALGATAITLQLDTGAVQTFPAFATNLQQMLQERWNRPTFDFLVNNAGFGISVPIADTKEADFDRLVNVQLKGVFFLTQRLLPLIADGGRIVNISSGLARFSNPGMAAYAMMKGGIEVFTRYLAKELGPRGITANTVAPGPTATDFGGGAIRDNEAYRQRIIAATALGRTGQPDDIGGMIAALLSDDNRWINGQRIEVSGGMNL